MELIYEYGLWVGVWCILCEFEKCGLLMMIFGVVMVLQCLFDVIQVFQELGYEIVCYGLKWIYYQNMDIEIEWVYMQEVVQIFCELIGSVLLGWYMGWDLFNMWQLVVEYGGFVYDFDYYGDDLLFWIEVEISGGVKVLYLVVFYMLDFNDMWFVMF